MTDEKDIELGHITIRLLLTDTDTLVGFECSDELTVMEMLGMLELAKATILQGDNAED